MSLAVFIVSAPLSAYTKSNNFVSLVSVLQLGLMPFLHMKLIILLIFSTYAS